MGFLTGALTAASGAMRGKAMADERFASEEQQRLQQERQARQDAMQREMQAASLQAMQQQQQRQTQQDQRSAYEGGYRTQVDATQMGDALAPAAMTQSDGIGGGIASAMRSVGQYGQYVQRAAKSTPAFTMGGKGMAKVGESLAEQSARMSAGQRRGERLEDYEHQMKRDETQAGVRAAERSEDRDFTRSENAKSRAATMAGITARLSGGGADPLKTLPAGVAQSVVSQNAALAQLDELEHSIGSDGKHLGLENFAGNTLANLFDAKGAPIRAMIANIGSLTYLDRSGAAVTPSEDERLKPLVPKSTDSPEVVQQKLTRLRAHIARERDMTGEYYQQQGYAVPRGPQQPIAGGDTAYSPGNPFAGGRR